MLMVPGLLPGQHGTDGNSMDWGLARLLYPTYNTCIKRCSQRTCQLTLDTLTGPIDKKKP